MEISDQTKVNRYKLHNIHNGMPFTIDNDEDLYIKIQNLTSTPHCTVMEFCNGSRRPTITSLSASQIVKPHRINQIKHQEDL